MQQYTLNPIARAIGKAPKDFTKEDMWDAVLEYAKRDRRFGGAVDKFADK